MDPNSPFSLAAAPRIRSREVRLLRSVRALRDAARLVGDVSPLRRFDAGAWRREEPDIVTYIHKYEYIYNILYINIYKHMYVYILSSRVIIYKYKYKYKYICVYTIDV